MSLCCRRHFLMGTATALIWIKPSGVIFGTELPKACASFDQSNWDRYPKLSTSKNRDLDNALVAELKNIIAIIPVNPEFHYIDEESPNAFALPTSDLPGTKGTVLLGLKLIKSLLDQQQSDGGGAIAGVCAHECAHVYQYATDFYSHLSGSRPILLELHADLLAGFYLAKRSGGLSAERVRSFSRALFERSGYDYTNPNYHGSPGLRLAAVERGYMFAMQGMNFPDAAKDGEIYVRRIAE